MGFVKLFSNDSATRILTHQLDTDGYFYLAVDPGAYKIDYVICAKPSGLVGGALGFGDIDRSQSVIIDVQFNVPRRKAVTYVGSINITHRAFGLGETIAASFRPTCSSVYKVGLQQLCVLTHSEVSIVDEYDSAVRAFRGRFPPFTEEVERSIATKG
jgi:hypothetical protein